MADVVRVQFRLAGDLLDRLAAAAEHAQAAERAWIAEEIARRVEREAADPYRAHRIGVEVRRDAGQLRAQRWPRIDGLVADALTRRLAERDMARRWRPLTPDERAQLSRGGRRLGTSYAAYRGEVLLDDAAATLPADLVWLARTAAHRHNEREVLPRVAKAATLDEEHAIYATWGQSLGRLIREGLDRYLPTAPPSAELHDKLDDSGPSSNTGPAAMDEPGRTH